MGFFVKKLTILNLFLKNKKAKKIFQIFILGIAIQIQSAIIKIEKGNGKPENKKRRSENE